MATKDFLAVDLGAESGRTVVARFDGKRIDLHETHRFPNGGVSLAGRLMWDLPRLWQEIKTGIAQSVKQFGAPTCIGVDTWGVDFGFIDDVGELAGLPVCYRDSRTDGMMEQAFSLVPKSEIYARTGLQFMKFNTLFQLLAVAKSARKSPFAGVDQMLLMPDLFNYLLTGVKSAEYTIASTTQMLDARTGQWDTTLLDRLGIPSRILPPLVAPGTKLGPVLTDVANETGAKGCAVTATAGHDTASAIIAAPTNRTDWCYISSGTWSLMGAELPAPAISEATRADNFTNEGGVCQTIRFLKNIMGLWLVQQCRRSLQRTGQEFDYTMLTRLAAEAKPFGPIINPDRDAFINPTDMPTAIREYCQQTGQAPPADVGSLIRCCLESLALRYRWVLDRLRKHQARPIEVIHILGGGSQNELLCQLTADCCQCLVITGPIEATAMGNALVQAMGTGDIGSLAQARQVVRESFLAKQFEPSPRTKPIWDERYGLFETLVARV